MKTLIIDIETRPSLGYVWRMYNNDLGLNQVESFTDMMCFAAKWHGDKKVHFYSTHHHGQDAMIHQAWKLLDEADAVVHFNGTSFDIPHLNREFLLAGLTPPSPYKEIDLLRTAKRRFRFFSNKLAHITEQLQLSGKLSHTGFQMWKDAIAGDERAWSLFRRYNIQDVRTTEELYDRLLPWISNHPHVGLYDGVEGDSCQRCGGQDLERRGFAYTPLGKFQQFRCRKCGGWSRGNNTLASVDVRGNG